MARQKQDAKSAKESVHSKSRRNNNRRGNNRGSKETSKDTTTPYQEDTPSQVNDVSWYSANPALLEGSANFSWFNPLGAKWTLDVPTEDISRVVMNDQRAPGLMTISLLPGPGVSQDATSPINIASRAIYSWVRHANSGHSNFEHADMMMYLLAMDDIYSYYSMLVRIYGLANTYSPLNRYYPKMVIEALGVNFDDLIQNLAQFRYYINSFGAKIGSFAVPGDMSYFKRHQWMYSGIYMDSASPKGQSYAFVPAGFRKYVETQGPGKLAFDYWNSNKKRTVQELINYGNELMNAVVLSEDCNVISGDIIKAFGVDNLFKIGVLDSSYTVQPLYALEVLSQIQNATVFNAAILGSGLNVDITQDPTTGNIIYTPLYTTKPSAPYFGNRLVNMYKDAITPADTMIATRLTAIPTEGKSGSYTFNSLGSEIAVDARVWMMDNSGNTYSKQFCMVNFASTQSNLDNMCEVITEINAFDYHPLVIVKFGIQAGADKLESALRLFQLNNYTVLNDKDLTKMHETALLSMFHCPQVAIMN